MTAVILDIQGEYAATLCEDGTIGKVSNDGYEIGQKIRMPSTDEVPAFKPGNNIISIRSEQKTGTHRILKRIGTLAATLILVVSLGTGVAYAMPYGTVSLDYNASIEYTINRFDYVIDVSANNEEGETVLDRMDRSLLINRKIDDAVANTMEQAETDGYCISESDTVLSVGTKGDNHSEQLAERLDGVAEYACVISVTMEDIEAAHEYGLTAGQNWMRNQTLPASETENTGNADVPASEPQSAVGKINGTDLHNATAGLDSDPDNTTAFKDSNGESGINGQNIPNSVLANTEPGNTNGANSFDETEYGKTPDNPGKPESVMNPPGRTADFS